MSCQHCNDTGKLPGSDYLDCGHCGAVNERLALNDFVSGVRQHNFTSFADMHWHIHQRARQIERQEQAARIAELERQLAEASAPAVEQQPVAWSYECQQNAEGTVWSEFIGRTKPKLTERDGVRNIKPLYAAPQAADTDKVREAISDEQIMRIAGDVKQRNAGAWPGDVAFARAVLASMAAQAPVREVPGWISVKDRLPEIGVDVVVYCGYMVTAQRTNDQHDPENHKGWVIDFDNGRATEITHWFPLPAAPVQQEGEKP